MRQFFHKGFSIVSALDESDGRALVDGVLNNELIREKVFRDNRRTLSARVLFQGQSLMLKVPRARNRRRWERLLTLFRESDAVRSYRHLELMKHLGFSAPEPLLACEFRQYGVVTDCFLCYRFVAGDPASADSAPLALAELIALHKHGYLRSDAQLANFLVAGNKITFIDFRLKKPWFFPQLQKARELDRFIRSCPEARNHLPSGEERSFWFRTASFLERLNFGFRSLKKRIRKRIKGR